jgi:hypothetical protein
MKVFWAASKALWCPCRLIYEYFIRLRRPLPFLQMLWYFDPRSPIQSVICLQRTLQQIAWDHCMVPEVKGHDAPCAMSAQGLTPLVKASEVKHFDGFRV